MVTIYRAHGLRIVIFTNDHEPAHVHVFGDGELKINLVGPEGIPALVWAQGMKVNDVRRAVQIVENQQDAFLAKWREIHG
ncbi:protein of unknown function [Roseovarius litoreus]|jgi:hypothetical protein|uniref:DUF4160 domain-containing protein n=1 Tax=Roseovarius litoreus TaxID=1155722 RepID=A0A1M7KXZ4_9RHOB|nr:DUF4160 domain-containing protein [Roseovarius litoreus]SHM70466.1 protein of unknown function [Roseovarius litoreus]